MTAEEMAALNRRLRVSNRMLSHRLDNWHIRYGTWASERKRLQGQVDQLRDRLNDRENHLVRALHELAVERGVKDPATFILQHARSYERGEVLH